MFCKNCGTQMDDNALFCPGCGAKKEEQQPVAVPVETPQTAQAEQPVWNEQPVQEPESKTPFNRKRFFAVTIPCLLLVLVLIFTGSYIGNAFVKLFTSSDGYFRYVTKNVAEQAVDEYADAYDEFLDLFTLKKGDNHMKLSLSMGDKLKQLLSTQAGLDVSKLSDVSVELDTFANNKQVSAAVELFVGGSKDALVSAQGTYDKKEQNLAATLPGLTESWIGVSLPGEVSGLIETLADTDFSKVLPKGKTLKAIVGSGVKSALQEVEDVEQTTDSFTAGDITQKGTKLSVNLDASDLRDMAVGFLNGVKDNKNLKKAVVDTMKNIEKLDLDLDSLGVSDLPDGDETYEAVVDMLDEAIDELDDTDMASNDFSIDLELYVDGKGTIYAYNAVVHNGNYDTVMSMGVTRKGGKTGMLFEAYGKTAGSSTEKQDHLLISGEGDLSLFGGFNGSAVLYIDDTNLIDFTFKDFKASLFSGKGTITMTPTDELMNMFSREATSLLGEGKLSASISFDISKKKQDVSIDLLQGDESLLKVAMENRVNKGEKVKLPKEDDIDFADSSDELADFTKSIDIDELKDRLGDLGLDMDDLDFDLGNTAQDVVAAPQGVLDSYADFAY